MYRNIIFTGGKYNVSMECSIIDNIQWIGHSCSHRTFPNCFSHSECIFILHEIIIIYYVYRL